MSIMKLVLEFNELLWEAHAVGDGTLTRQPQMIYLIKQGLHRILAINRSEPSEILQTGIVLPT